MNRQARHSPRANRPLRAGNAGIFLLLLLIGVVIILAMYVMPIGGGGAGGNGTGAATGGTSYLDTIAKTQDMGEHSHVLQTTEAIATDLVIYYTEHNRYPDSIEELADHTARPYLDPWDDPLRLTIDDDRPGPALFIVSSRGNDGQWDTEDDIVIEKTAPF